MFRDPNINDVSPDDLALLGGDNNFCSGSSCIQTFNGGLDVASLEVGGDLDVGSKSVFGVDVPRLESTRVSLTEDQTLNGNYHFSTLNVGSTLNSGSQARGCDFPIVANTLLKKKLTRGKHFSVSFEILVESFHPTSKWTEFFRFTTDENDDAIAIPAILVHNDGHIIIDSKVGKVTERRGSPIVAGTWTKVEIKQYPEDGKTMYEVLVDGVSRGMGWNNDPREYENVKVLVGWNKWYEIVDGRIRNLKAGKNLKSKLSFTN